MIENCREPYIFEIIKVFYINFGLYSYKIYIYIFKILYFVCVHLFNGYCHLTFDNFKVLRFSAIFNH